MALHVGFFSAMIVGWLKGGRPERITVAMLLLSQLVFLHPSFDWRIGDIYIDSAIEDALWSLFFGWLAFRSDRWWPLVITATMALTMLIHILTIVTDISWDAAVSARVGLGLLTYVTLLAGVSERWLAGEAAGSDINPWRPTSGSPQGSAPSHFST